eukprot:CFRG3657T1
MELGSARADAQQIKQQIDELLGANAKIYWNLHKEFHTTNLSKALFDESVKTLLSGLDVTRTGTSRTSDVKGSGGASKSADMSANAIDLHNKFVMSVVRAATSAQEEHKVDPSKKGGRKPQVALTQGQKRDHDALDFGKGKSTSVPDNKKRKQSTDMNENVLHSPLKIRFPIKAEDSSETSGTSKFAGKVHMSTADSTATENVSASTTGVQSTADTQKTRADSKAMGSGSSDRVSESGVVSSKLEAKKKLGKKNNSNTKNLTSATAIKGSTTKSKKKDSTTVNETKSNANLNADIVPSLLGAKDSTGGVSITVGQGEKTETLTLAGGARTPVPLSSTVSTKKKTTDSSAVQGNEFPSLLMNTGTSTSTFGSGSTISPTITTTPSAQTAASTLIPTLTSIPASGKAVVTAKKKKSTAAKQRTLGSDNTHGKGKGGGKSASKAGGKTTDKSGCKGEGRGGAKSGGKGNVNTTGTAVCADTTNITKKTASMKKKECPLIPSDHISFANAVLPFGPKAGGSKSPNVCVERVDTPFTRDMKGNTESDLLTTVSLQDGYVKLKDSLGSKHATPAGPSSSSSISTSTSTATNAKQLPSQSQPTQKDFMEIISGKRNIPTPQQSHHSQLLVEKHRHTMLLKDKTRETLMSGRSYSATALLALEREREREKQRENDRLQTLEDEKDEILLCTDSLIIPGRGSKMLAKRMQATAAESGLVGVEDEALGLVADAVREHLKIILKSCLSLKVDAMHRLEVDGGVYGPRGNRRRTDRKSADVTHEGEALCSGNLGTDNQGVTDEMGLGSMEMGLGLGGMGDAQMGGYGIDTLGMGMGMGMGIEMGMGMGIGAGLGINMNMNVDMGVGMSLGGVGGIGAFSTIGGFGSLGGLGSMASIGGVGSMDIGSANTLGSVGNVGGGGGVSSTRSSFNMGTSCVGMGGGGLFPSNLSGITNGSPISTNSPHDLTTSNPISLNPPSLGTNTNTTSINLNTGPNTHSILTHTSSALSLPSGQFDGSSTLMPRTPVYGTPTELSFSARVQRTHSFGMNNLSNGIDVERTTSFGGGGFGLVDGLSLEGVGGDNSMSSIDHIGMGMGANSGFVSRRNSEFGKAGGAFSFSPNSTDVNSSSVQGHISATRSPVNINTSAPIGDVHMDIGGSLGEGVNGGLSAQHSPEDDHAKSVEDPVLETAEKVRRPQFVGPICLEDLLSTFQVYPHLRGDDRLNCERLLSEMWQV